MLVQSDIYKLLKYRTVPKL